MRNEVREGHGNTEFRAHRRRSGGRGARVHVAP